MILKSDFFLKLLNTVISVQMCSNAEHQAIDSIIDKGATQAGMMDLKVAQGKRMIIVLLSSHMLCNLLLVECITLAFLGGKVDSPWVFLQGKIVCSNWLVFKGCD